MFKVGLLRGEEYTRHQNPRAHRILHPRRRERRLAKDPEWIRAYNTEIQKLVQACSVLKLEPSALTNDRKSWYIPHYMVSHNGKNHIAFNCSYHFRGLNLNESPLSGPSRGPSLLGSAAMFQRASRCNQQRHRRDVSSGPPPT